MSNDLSNLVWRSSIRPMAKRVTMLALANAANDDGVCWPSVDLLVEHTGAARSTVVNSLAALEDEGFISKERRRSKSTVYTVNRDRLQESTEPEVRVAEGPESGRPEIGPSEIGTSGNQTLEGPDSGLWKVQNLDPSKENHQRTTKEPSARATKRPAKRKPANRETPIPEDWHPTDPHRVRAEQLGLDLAEQAELFRLHAEGHDRRMANWNSGFTSWLIKAPKLPGNQRRAQPAALSGDAAEDWLRAEWQAGRVRQVEERTGLRYPVPDLPLGVDGPDAIRTWQITQARDWIAANRELILNRLAHRSAS